MRNAPGLSGGVDGGENPKYDGQTCDHTGGLMDDRDAPHRRTNTAVLNQIGQPPPASILAAVLTVTGGVEPTSLAAIVDWGEGTTQWRVVGCTQRMLFEITAKKPVDDWYGGTDRQFRGPQEELSACVVPLARVTSATFTLSRVVPSRLGFGQTSIEGTWKVTSEDGSEVEIPTTSHKQQTREELFSVANAVLAAL